jgi:magnesium-transporting ATPase (P-type)
VGTADAGALDSARAASLPAADVLRALGSRRQGLRSREAEVRLAQVGANVVPTQKGPSLTRRLVDQFVHFFALMLWVAAGLALVGRLPELSVAIVVVIVVNGLFSFWQEAKADRAVSELAALLPASAFVRRDGRERELPAAELVPGDVVLLREGDAVSADARVLRSSGLRIDESLLTGESASVERDTVTLDAPPADALSARCLVFAGTYVVAGSGLVVVVATGGRTRLGGIAALTAGVERRATPLRDQLDRLVRTIAVLAVAVGVAFFGATLALGTDASDGFVLAVGVIVALVPEGLLPTLSLSLAGSAHRMADRRVLVRRLESVETLGATTVICTDKTGTLTENEMTVAGLARSGRAYATTGSGYDPRGAILQDGRPLSADELSDLRPLLRALVLCNDARLESEQGRWRCVGDPTEGALLTVGRKGGVEGDAEERAAPRIRVFPFDSERRRMCTIHRLPSGEVEALVKGSPEAVLTACSRVARPDGTVELDSTLLERITADVELLAARGQRVLAAARRTLSDVPVHPEQAERELELLGLVGLVDPIRPEVPDAIARCRSAGIRVVMITGDHPATASAIARAAGLVDGPALTGTDLPIDDGELALLLADEAVSVIARVAPEQKLRIARALQDTGEVVAMTGDGVNDAPALRQADIGVAMGVVGTDVAREAADIVLLDDNFAHIVEAVEEGRATFDNIRRFLTYHLTDNVAELTPFAVWALSGGSFPLMLSVLQVLALDIGTDLLPALALGAERPAPDVMHRPPRPRDVRLLDRNVLGRAFGFLGPVEAITSLAMVPIGAALFFGWPDVGLPREGPDQETLSAMVFAAIVAMQMANAFACRSNPASLRSIGPLSNRLLVQAVVVEGIVLLAFVYVPPIAAALGGQPLGWGQWGPVLVTPFVLLTAEETRKSVVRRRRASHGGSASLLVA